jgi:hypothetical protein
MNKLIRVIFIYKDFGLACVAVLSFQWILVFLGNMLLACRELKFIVRGAGNLLLSNSYVMVLQPRRSQVGHTLLCEHQVSLRTGCNFNHVPECKKIQDLLCQNDTAETFVL